MPSKDYSHRDVTDKLGLKPGQAVRVAGKSDKALLARVREKTGRRLSGAAARADVILYWPLSVAEITPRPKELRSGLAPAGAIWVITAKRGQTSPSGMGYLNQADLIPLGLAAGLVDNKTCSISERESGLRFVIRRRDRRSLVSANVLP